MLRIRLHGRGGQGIKTASQILGSAAFLSGFQAQDFPLYGAERRGAPIVAYTRIAEDFVLERGPITRPDLILVGDETLLDDPLSAPASGADEHTIMFINSKHSPVELKEHFHLTSLPVVLDLTEYCMRYIGSGVVLSSALSAAGARISALIGLDTLLEAVRMELEDLGVGPEMIKNNVDLASEIYANLPSIQLTSREEGRLAANPMLTLRQEDVTSAAPLILAHANMGLKKTGNWRIQRPEIDLEHCNGCWICFARCPDGTIHIGDHGKPVIDYDHCKGCLICAVECPSESINVVREAAVWT
jgi:pyruvate ferredoxin oxidoreductase gamma subunit